MKNIFIVLLIIVLFSSCSNLLQDSLDVGQDAIYATYVYGKQLYKKDFGDIETYSDIVNYLKENLKYENDSFIFDSPEIALKKGHGDCDEFSMAFMNIAYVELGIKCELAVVDIADRQIVSGGKIEEGHSIVLINGNPYDPQAGYFTNDKVRFKYSFDHVFPFK